MPVERGYERQVRPSAATPRALVSPEAMGAGIGAAVARLGEGVHRDRVRAYEIERQRTRDQEAIDAQKRLAAIRDNMDGVSRELRDNAAPGGAGHAQAVHDAYEAHRETLLDGITEESVRARAEAQFDDFGGRLRANEAQWEDGKRIAKTVGDAQDSSAIGGNRARRLHDPGAYADELKFGYESIDQLQGIDADTKEKLKRHHGEVVTVGYVNGLNDTNPMLAREMLDKGLFDGILTPQQIDGLRSGAEVEVRRVEAAAEHEQAMAAAALREKIATLKEADSQGIDVSEQLPEAIKAATAAGDTSTALQLEGIAVNQKYAKIYKGQTPVQRETRLTELGRVRNPNADQQREIKWLEDHRGALDERFNADPAGWAVTNAPAGGKPPPLDWGNPGSMRAREAWAARASQVYGRPVSPVTANEAAQMAANLQEPGGEKAALEALDQFDDPFARAAAARQIAPNDRAFQHMAQLQPQVRATVRAGQQKLAADKAFLTPSDDRKKEVLAKLDHSLDVALREMQPEDVETARSLARQYLAGVLAKQGLSGDAITADNYTTALMVGLGGEVRNGRRTGGLGTWGEKPFVVPDGMTAQDFGKAVVKAVGAERANPPVNPDGSAFDLRKAYPVFLGGGRYRWETSRRTPVLAKDGTPYVMVLGQ